MDTEKNNFEELFNNFQGQWDSDEPALGHQQRFLKRLKNKKKKKSDNFLYKLVIPAAAAILVLLGVILIYQPAAPQQQLAKVSPQVKETEMYFTSIIEKELAKVERENTPETKVLIQDALQRMQVLEKDYDKLMQELVSKGENKRIIHAMIINLQTRISFLEEVLTQIENIKKIKENYNESKTI